MNIKDRLTNLWNNLLKSYTFNIFAWLGIFDVIFWIFALAFTYPPDNCGSDIILTVAYIVYVPISLIIKGLILFIYILFEQFYKILFKKNFNITTENSINIIFNFDKNLYSIILLFLLMVEILTDSFDIIIVINNMIKDCALF